MAARVARHVEHLGLLLAEFEFVAFGERHVDAGDAGAVGQGPDDDGAVTRLQFEIAAGMVVVVMGVEDMGELQAEAVERGRHRRRHRGIDRGHGPAFGLAQQVDVIVPQHRDLADFQLGHGGRD